jgi:hypothetical protein
LPSDPFVRFLEGAPIDDEPVSAEEEAAVADTQRAFGARLSQMTRSAQPKPLHFVT